MEVLEGGRPFEEKRRRGEIELGTHWWRRRRRREGERERRREGEKEGCSESRIKAGEGE